MATSDKKIQDIIAKVKKYPGKKVKLAVADIDGILRGKIVSLDKFLSIADGGFGFCDVVFGWDSSDTSYDNGRYTGWHTGYPDAPAKVDLNTFRTVPWDNDIPFFLSEIVDKEGAPADICPRQLVKKIKQRSLDMGFYPVTSQEFEWFNFENTPQELEDGKFTNLKPMTPGMFGYSLLRSSAKKEYFNALFDDMAAFDVPIEGLHTETGPGVYEVAITYGDMLESADRAVLFKTAAKEIAERHGVMASFMAKWDMSLPGCSGHVHQSLWDAKRKKNLFYDKKGEHGMSDVMRSYIAGQLHCLPHILPMYAPTINSFKRLVEGAWAPTTLTWAIDNRTTALRALPGSATSTRLETRVPGSDVNPYLAMSAAVASGLYGIEKGLKLEQPATVGNGYEDFSNGTLPKDLNEATQLMKHSDIAKELFGEGFVDHYTRTREWEWREFGKTVTDWELKRYFEII